MTTEPTKEMIALARECAAQEAERQYPHIPEMAAKFRAGENDDYGFAVGAALAAIQETTEMHVAWLHSLDEGALKGWRPEALANAIARGDFFKIKETPDHA